MQNLTFENADSKEEVYFSWWLNELLDAGFIVDWEYQSKTYTLSERFQYQVCKKLKTKTKIEDRLLLHPHTYTPDFIIKWNKAAYSIFYMDIGDGMDIKKFPIVAQQGISTIDVKPAAWGRGDDFMKLFTVRQKWLFQRHSVYVQPVVVTGKKTALFESTFTPGRFLFTDKSKAARKLKFRPVMLNEFLEG